MVGTGNVTALDVGKQGKLIWQAEFGAIRNEPANRPGSRPVPYDEYVERLKGPLAMHRILDA